MADVKKLCVNVFFYILGLQQHDHHRHDLIPFVHGVYVREGRDSRSDRGKVSLLPFALRIENGLDWLRYIPWTIYSSRDMIPTRKIGQSHALYRGLTTTPLLRWDAEDTKGCSGGILGTYVTMWIRWQMGWERERERERERKREYHVTRENLPKPSFF